MPRLSLVRPFAAPTAVIQTGNSGLACCFAWIAAVAPMYPRVVSVVKALSADVKQLTIFSVVG